MTLIVLLAEGASEIGGSQTLLQYGALGVMVMGLAWFAVMMMKENRQLYRERIEAEQRFRGEKVELILKYKEGLEKVNQTLEATNRVVERAVQRFGG